MSSAMSARQRVIVLGASTALVAQLAHQLVADGIDVTVDDNHTTPNLPKHDDVKKVLTIEDRVSTPSHRESVEAFRRWTYGYECDCPSASANGYFQSSYFESWVHVLLAHRHLRMKLGVTILPHWRKTIGESQWCSSLMRVGVLA